MKYRIIDIAIRELEQQLFHNGYSYEKDVLLFDAIQELNRVLVERIHKELTGEDIE